jgi:hypothetical protein
LKDRENAEMKRKLEESEKKLSEIKASKDGKQKEVADKLYDTERENVELKR